MRSMPTLEHVSLLTCISILATCLGRLGMSLHECSTVISRLREKVEDPSGKIWLPYFRRDKTTVAAETVQKSVPGVDEFFVRDGCFGKDGRCETYGTGGNIQQAAS